MNEASILEVLLNKETIFFGLFLYLFWSQQQEKKSQNSFILEQQNILSDLSNSYGNLTNSFDKMVQNQEKLTGRVEKIEVVINRKGDENDGKTN